MTSPTHRHRILYVGTDLSLLDLLNRALKHPDCQIVRCPGGSPSHALIQSDIKYSLLLFDSKGTRHKRGETQTLRMSTPTSQAQPPFIILKKSDEFDALAKTIIQSLASQDQAD